MNLHYCKLNLIIGFVEFLIISELGINDVLKANPGLGEAKPRHLTQAEISSGAPSTYVC